MKLVDPEWGTLNQKKPPCYGQMDKMKALPEKCRTCTYKVDCMIKTAKSKGELTD